MALLIFLILFSTSLLSASEGYPTARVDIIYNKEAVIKNDFCFPVVVSVNNRDVEVEAMTSMPLGIHQWTKWNWMPGKMKIVINSKTVNHPLNGNPKVSFGPEETETHKGADSYSYDFGVPEGTPVKVMEEGKVIRIISHYKVAHQDKTKMDQVNTIEIIHVDGTVARYSHLRPNSSKVTLCQNVRIGQVIAESGNVGFSKGPHLHVDIFKPISGESHKTIPLKFR